MLILNFAKKNIKGEVVLVNACDISITKEINENNSLEFSLPISDESGIDVGDIVMHKDEKYIVEKISKNYSNNIYKIQCTHLFVFQAKRAHIPAIASTDAGDFIGEDLRKVLENAYNKIYNYGFDYNLMRRDTDINTGNYAENGVTELSQEIDYESEERTTLWDVMKNIISAAGQGEIFYKGNLFGLVERIGSDTGVVISSIHNMNSVSVEIDMSEMITVLYPYGKEGMDITSAENNKNKTAYMISEDNADMYGYVIGHKEYDISDLETSGPDTLYNRALWEFDDANPDRIDVPSVNISGSVTDIGIPEGIHLGDSVTVLINGKPVKERIIKIKEYYDGRPVEVSIGRVKKDMFYYLNKIGVFTHRYKNISTIAGKIYGSKVSGTVTVTNTANKANTASVAVTLSNSDSQTSIDGTGIKVLSEGKTFFSLNQKNLSVGSALAVTSEGKATANLTELILAGNAFTVDSDGNLYYNGKKVQLVEEET